MLNKKFEDKERELIFDLLMVIANDGDACKKEYACKELSRILCKLTSEIQP